MFYLLIFFADDFHFNLNLVLKNLDLVTDIFEFDASNLYILYLNFGCILTFFSNRDVIDFCS